MSSIPQMINVGICSCGRRSNNTSRCPVTPTALRREYSVASVKFGSCASLYSRKLAVASSVTAEMVPAGRVLQRDAHRFTAPEIATYGETPDVTLSLGDDNADDIHKPDTYGANPPDVMDVTDVTGHKLTNLNHVPDDNDDINDNAPKSPANTQDPDVIANVTDTTGDDNHPEGGDWRNHPLDCDCIDCS